MANKYNIGDTVTVTAIVVSDRVAVDGTVQCDFNAPLLVGQKNIIFCVPEEDIASHTPKPRPIQAGDIVAYGHAELTVIAIHDDSAWLERNDENQVIVQKYYTLKLRDLERIQ